VSQDIQAISTGIREAAFTCRRCGACCTEIEPGSNLVLVSPGEVRAIMARTGQAFEEVAEPYPDTIREGEREYTFGWAVRREHGRCIFLQDQGCSVYEVRPWICRTYPFMLENGVLRIFPCSGTGTTDREISLDHAGKIAEDLFTRQRSEEEEEERVATVLSQVTIPPGRMVVIDGEGMKVING